jgi:hypothetical protein
METKGSLPYSPVPTTCPFSFCCVAPHLETLSPRRSEWGSSLPPDCFVSGRSISTYEYYWTLVFSRRGVVSTSPNPQAGGPPLVGCLQLLIQFIHSYPPYRGPFLYPQPEDAPCRGDRDPHSWTLVYIENDRLSFISCIAPATTVRMKDCCWLVLYPTCVRFIECT